MRGNIPNYRVKNICYNIHNYNNFRVLAVCDKEVLGKVIREKPFFMVSSSFYHKKTIGRKQLEKLLKEHTNINLVGENTVMVAIENAYAKKEHIKYIGKIPHLQIYKIK